MELAELRKLVDGDEGRIRELASADLTGTGSILVTLSTRLHQGAVQAVFRNPRISDDDFSKDIKFKLGIVKGTARLIDAILAAKEAVRKAALTDSPPTD